MDNFAANNYLGPVGGANAIIKSKRKYSPSNLKIVTIC